ncbi:MAG: aspartate racemase [Clostridiales bacterium]|nr:MAG: aspartate racemase [Clostridiales bacterium]
MKKIGLIGGISWKSSVVYYEEINRKIEEKIGGLSSCRCILESVNFSEIVKYQENDNWKKLDEIMKNAAKNLEKAGADCVLICANTMHLCANAVKRSVSIPVIHIAEATGEKIKIKKISKVLLLGTRFTMKKDFYKNILKEKYDIDTIIPDEDDIEIVDRVIFEELVHGTVLKKSKEEYKRIIDKSLERGAEGVILGCTEIPLLIRQEDVSMPVFDTLKIHAEKAVEFALE